MIDFHRALSLGLGIVFVRAGMKMLCLSLMLAVLFFAPQNLRAQDGTCLPPPAGYPISFCQIDIAQDHDDNIAKYAVKAMMKMTEQFTVTMSMQALAIGQFFDGKEQMDAYMTMDRLKAQAHKDYHPSEQLCAVGSYMRSVAKSEASADINRAVIQKNFIDYASNADGMESQTGPSGAVMAQVNRYKEVYCDPDDVNASAAQICSGGGDPERMNKDIDPGRTLISPLSLALDFTDDVEDADEQDVLALARNLYWPNVLSVPQGTDGSKREAIYRARQLIAKTALAHQSLSALAGQKSKVSDLNEKSGTAFMKAMLKDFGLGDRAIDDFVGEKPSLYAQMDVLTRQIYQNPDFYTNLYDKPSNVTRINVALEALQLMHLRQRYESQLRRELLASQLLEDAIVEAVPADFY